MILNEMGEIAKEELLNLNQRFDNLELDVYQIMPNHVHAILVLADVSVGATLAVAQPQRYSKSRSANNKLSNIIGAYKSCVFKACLKICTARNETMGSLWQRNYHEHFIRNLIEYQPIAQYISDNPKRWKADKFFNG